MVENGFHPSAINWRKKLFIYGTPYLDTTVTWGKNVRFKNMFRGRTN
jgi:hypothetical protein